MTILHVLNAVAWGANSVLWFGYAHVPMMGVASGVAALIAAYMAWRAD
jgi:hypothetical protein